MIRPASTVPDDYMIPEDVLDITGPDPAPVWLNQTGGLTVRFESEHRTRYLKRNPLPSTEDLELEARKLDWLRDRHPVPRRIEHRRRTLCAGEVEYLITEALPGTNAVDPSNSAEANRTIVAIAHGLRALHSLPIDECPWTWPIEDRLQTIDAEAAVTGLATSASEFGPVAAGELGPAPGSDRFVVCHGDPCAPNTLLSEDGSFLANVDMQRLGVGDRWADLAVATMSFGWNYVDYDESLFWKAYGVEPDAERIWYYRRLWNAE